MKRVLNALAAWAVYPAMLALLLVWGTVPDLVVVIVGLAATAWFLEDLSGRPSERRGAVR